MQSKAAHVATLGIMMKCVSIVGSRVTGRWNGLLETANSEGPAVEVWKPAPNSASAESPSNRPEHWIVLFLCRSMSLDPVFVSNCHHCTPEAYFLPVGRDGFAPSSARSDRLCWSSHPLKISSTVSMQSPLVV